VRLPDADTDKEVSYRMLDGVLHLTLAKAPTFVLL
jgi:HSP20 family molecular chaperone IbpA